MFNELIRFLFSFVFVAVPVGAIYGIYKAAVWIREVNAKLENAERAGIVLSGALDEVSALRFRCKALEVKLKIGIGLDE